MQQKLGSLHATSSDFFLSFDEGELFRTNSLVSLKLHTGGKEEGIKAFKRLPLCRRTYTASWCESEEDISFSGLQDGS